MTGDSFFDRWSRRKRSDAAPAPMEEPPAAEESPAAVEEVDAEFIASLPDPATLTAESNIADFLRKGVPAALRNAAMRRMWQLDPVISTHKDIAVDYAWDWNVPGGVPGNGGAISQDGIAKLLRGLSRPPEPTAAPEEAEPSHLVAGLPPEEPAAVSLDDHTEPPEDVRKPASDAENPEEKRHGRARPA